MREEQLIHPRLKPGWHGGPVASLSPSHLPDPKSQKFRLFFFTLDVVDLPGSSFSGASSPGANSSSATDYLSDLGQVIYFPFAR